MTGARRRRRRRCQVVCAVECLVRVSGCVVAFAWELGGLGQVWLRGCEIVENVCDFVIIYVYSGKFGIHDGCDE